MKVSETSRPPLQGFCDFCSKGHPEHTINGGLWWVCRDCMDAIYSECFCTEDYRHHHMSYCKFEGEEE